MEHFDHHWHKCPTPAHCTLHFWGVSIKGLTSSAFQAFHTNITFLCFTVLFIQWCVTSGVCFTATAGNAWSCTVYLKGWIFFPIFNFVGFKKRPFKNNIFRMAVKRRCTEALIGHIWYVCDVLVFILVLILEKQTWKRRTVPKIPLLKSMIAIERHPGDKLRPRWYEWHTGHWKMLWYLQFSHEHPVCTLWLFTVSFFSLCLCELKQKLWNAIETFHLSELLATLLKTKWLSSHMRI